MNITHDMSNDLTEYDPESRQVDGPNPIENRISSSAARVPDSTRTVAPFIIGVL